MKIRDLLKTKEFQYRTVVTLIPNETIPSAIQKMVEHDRGSLPVCNDKDELVGIITERDVVRRFYAYRCVCQHQDKGYYDETSSYRKFRRRFELCNQCNEAGKNQAPSYCG